MARFLRATLSLLLVLAPLVAQTDANKAQVNGTVTDPNGAVVPNAVVKIKNSNTGLLRELKSNSEANTAPPPRSRRL